MAGCRHSFVAILWKTTLVAVAFLMLPGRALAGTPDTIFGGATPATVNSGDAHSVELGVKFSSEVAGEVTGVRFYKSTANTGTHIGSLWSASGTLLASATFTNETASGWQQVNFSTPVPIAANTTYVAAYLAPKGDYSDTASAFATAGVSSPPLSALANSVSANGVFTYSSTSTFPTNSFKATNYWVDVDFEPEPATTTAPGQVTNVTATAGTGSANLTWSAPTSGGAPTTYTITPYFGTAAQPTTTINGTPPATKATITGLTNGTSYTFTVTATNTVGPGPASEHSNTITPTAPTEPAAPTGVTATEGEASATVRWTAPANGGSTITKYTITPYVGTAAQPTTTITGTPPETSATITGLTNGTSYTFTVTASNAIGAGPPSEHSNAVTPTSAPIAYPDLQLVMPVGDINIQHSGSTRTLEFTHITANLGAGPFEIRPVYNSLTGISQGYQALYTMPSPGVWKFSQLVPIVGPMVWTPPSDYNFPLDKFGLYSVASGGGVGSLVETSPKDLFCITSDTEVGGVPNTPSKNEYPGFECAKPEGRLGMSVGWGDQYEATDGGEGIPITNVPDGTYWLQGIADPDHYFAESNAANNITDTKLQIEGTTVKVLEQTHPSSPPPTVSLTSPATEATVSGTTTLTATASGEAPISSVQFLLDGEPIGAPVTSPPYTLSVSLGNTSPGKHFLSAQATDSNGFVGTATDVPVTVLESSGSGGEPPTISIANPVAGETVSNTTLVSAAVNGGGAIRSVQFLLDGTALGEPVTSPPYAFNWNTTTASNGQHTLTAKVTDTIGEVATSAPVTVRVQNPAEEEACFTMDVTVSVNGQGPVTTQTFTTAEPEEQLFAFVSADGPNGAGKQSATVSGAGLSWTLVKRANSEPGDAEIWTARAKEALSNVTVTSTPSAGGFDQELTVISMQMSNGVGASAAAGAVGGAPSVSLKTSSEGSLVYAVGADYDHAISRTLGPNQVLLRQNLDTSAEETFWSQFTNAITGPAGETVTMDDTAPTGDRWDMASVEILGDGD